MLLGLLGGDDFLIFFSRLGGLGSWADKVPGCIFVGSEGIVLGMLDGWSFGCMTRNIPVVVGVGCPLSFCSGSYGGLLGFHAAWGLTPWWRFLGRFWDSSL